MKRIVLFFVLLAPLLGKAQPALSIYSYDFYVPAIPNSATTEFKLVHPRIRNYSNVEFEDFLYVTATVDSGDGNLNFMDSVNTGFTYLDTLGSLIAPDSILIDTILFDFDPGMFKDGNNTVVIWPAHMDGHFTLDSLVLVLNYASVNELMSNDINVTLGPNPTPSFFYLGDPEKLVKQVRIRTLEGKLMVTASTNQYISVESMSNGIYLVELQTDKAVYSRKLVIRR